MPQHYNAVQHDTALFSFADNQMLTSLASIAAK